jgi:FMN phosphatase YigB (HAD superfamily)
VVVCGPRFFWRTFVGRAVFFDLDETLIEHTLGPVELVRKIHAAHARAMEGVSEETFRVVLREKAAAIWGTMFEPTEPGVEPLVGAFRRTLETLGGDTGQARAMRDTFVELVLAGTRPHAGAKEALAELRARGVTTGIITNGYSYFQELKIAHHGFVGLTDFVLVSEAAGAHKPDSRIFQLALEHAGAAAPEAWHVGDHLVNDIGGAERAGIAGVLYDPKGDRLPAEGSALTEGARRPRFVVKNLPEVAPLASGRGFGA